MNTTLRGLAGEYYVLAQLAHRGLVGTLTLSSTKGVDILVANPQLNKVRKVEVKTSGLPARHAKLFGKGKYWIWQLSEKNERLKDPRLFYCFVALPNPDQKPMFFIVPSACVAKSIAREHRYWIRTRGTRDNPIRQFRIPVEDPNHYENNWGVFEK